MRLLGSPRFAQAREIPVTFGPCLARAAAAARDADNRARADAWWPSLPQRLVEPDVEAFFAGHALPDPPPPLTRA